MSHESPTLQPRRASLVQETDGMSHGESSRRASRTRTAVATYNLKALSRISGLSHQQDLDEDIPTVNLRSRSHTPPAARNEIPRARSPQLDPLSRTTSPMPTTEIPVFGTSLAIKSTDTGTRDVAVSDTDGNINVFDCFNTQDHPRGHYYSALELFKRGVWIGYLAPERHKESFGGLPSFNNLKGNYKSMSNPYPPPVYGIIGKARKAVCRGCASESSVALDLSEIQYFKNTKLVIMPLDGDDEAGMFCVMIPQSSDRTLTGLQSYRPYEITSGGDGNGFANNYMLLALRNPDRDPSAGTLQAVLEVLPLQECRSINQWFIDRPKVVAHGRSAFPSPTKTPKQETPLLTTRVSSTSKHDQINDCEKDDDWRSDGLSSRKRRKTSAAGFLHQSASRKKGNDSSKPKAQSTTGVSKHITCTQSNAPVSPGPSASPPQTNKSPAPVEVLPLSLTHEQASRVQFIWRKTDDDIETEFTHNLDECKTFKGLLGLLEEEAEGMKSASEDLAKTKVWQMTYKLGSAAKKANIVRKGTEAGFNRLKAVIASSSFLSDHPHALLDVEVTSHL